MTSDNKLLSVSPSPHIKHPDNTKSIMLDVLIAMLPALIWSVYVFGWRSLSIVVISVASCIAFEYFYQKLMKKLVPWYFGPMREKMMRLLLTILTDG